mmetsp:Transcript_31590/g.50755  ORF Transcript_31590/g.50755 Transcript_31590/m.50755 type:complete len:86 (+) Transcript_31590:85-342(+)
MLNILIPHTHAHAQLLNPPNTTPNDSRPTTLFRIPSEDFNLIVSIALSYSTLGLLYPLGQVAVTIGQSTVGELKTLLAFMGPAGV